MALPGRAVAERLKYRLASAKENVMIETVKELNGFHTHPYPNGHTNEYKNGADHSHDKAHTKQAVETAVRTILANVGEDPDREGLVGTPDRIARMYDEVLAGYTTDPVKLVNNALFDVDYDEPVIVKEIEYFSMCEHHMLPFFGRAHIAYIPSDKVIGLSKIPRIVEMFARRLQVQERMTRQIAEMIDEILAPQGVAVVIEGSHMCSMMRGVKKEHPRMMTSYMIGKYKEDKDIRREFMDQLRK